jgi:TolB-like protein/DNA-binding winged helix-turn-helix (wHTH) protein
MDRATQPDVIRFGMFRADFRTQELRKGGIRIKLPRQSFLILQMLLEHPGELVSRDSLRQNLWPADIFVDFDHGLNNAVTRLRDALNDSTEAPRYIETLPRLGYRFIANLEHSENAAISEENSAPTVARPNRRKGYAIWIAAVAALGLAALGGVLLRSSPSHWRNRIFHSSKPLRSLAVLPLENLSGDAAQEYFADGITDELITEMAQLKPLRVISKTSVMRYKGAYRGTRKSLPEIASELGVDAVLEGSVMRSAERVRITVQLIEARNDAHLWSGEYTREMRDIISLQRDVAGDIAQQIRLQLLPEQRARLAATRPVDPEAYELFLKGLHFWDMRTVDSMRQSITYFSQSVSRDAEFAPAWAYTSTSHCILQHLSAEPPAVGHQKALAAAQKALELDPLLPEGHTAMGCIRFLFEWDLYASLRELQKAIETNPSYELAHQWSAYQLLRGGRPQAAVEEMKRALAVDPLSLRVNMTYAGHMMDARQYSDAIHQYTVVLDLFPTESSSRRQLAAAYDGAGDTARAGQELEKFLSADELGRAFLKSCQPFEYRRCQALFAAEEAKRDLASLELRQKKGEYVSPASFADAYLRLGDKKKAIQWLGAACDERSAYPLSVALPQFDSLRSEPGFQALVTRVGLPQETSLAISK